MHESHNKINPNGHTDSSKYVTPIRPTANTRATAYNFVINLTHNRKFCEVSQQPLKSKLVTLDIKDLYFNIPIRRP